MAQSYKKNKKKPMPEHVSDAWKIYFSTRDNDAKDLLINHYQFLVRNIMRPFWAKKPFILEMDDLKQAGNLGLLQAIERYKEDSDASFETFAQLRVKGAMLDEINSLDWTPRNMRKQIRNVLEAESRLVAENIQITDDLIAEMTGFTLAEVSKARASAYRTFILPVDQDSIREMESAPKAIPHASNNMSSSLDGMHKGSEGLDFRIFIMRELYDKRERQVIYLKFFCSESLGNIAKILDMPVTHVSAIHKSALERLRNTYRNPKDTES